MSAIIKKLNGTQEMISISNSFEEFQTQVNDKLGLGYVIIFNGQFLTREKFDEFKTAARNQVFYAIRPTPAAGAAALGAPEDGKKKRKRTSIKRRTSKRRSIKRRSSKRRSLKRRSSK